MAKFSFHGHPDTIESLRDELPTDGTSWDQYLLEAVRLRKRAAGPGMAKEIRNLESKERITEELPNGDYDSVEYILECIELRKRIEARDLVLTEPDTTPVEERE